MIARGKRRLAAAALIVFAAWPLAHYALVRSYQLHPWKFGGWAMYTVINYRPRIQVFVHRGDDREKLKLRNFPAAQAARRQLSLDTYFYGLLANTEPLGRAAAAAVGGDAKIEIVITRHFVDRESALVSATKRSIFYEGPR